MNDDVKAIIAGAISLLTLMVVAVDYKGFDGIIGTGADAFSKTASALTNVKAT